jgi:hypothetical protein
MISNESEVSIELKQMIKSQSKRMYEEEDKEEGLSEIMNKLTLQRDSLMENSSSGGYHEDMNITPLYTPQNVPN